MRGLVVLSLAILCALPITARAQQSGPDFTAAEKAALLLAQNHVRRVQPEHTLATVLREAGILFQTLDLDGGGISKSDEELKTSLSHAAVRASLIRQWLAFDLNGDANLTPDEIQRALMPQARQPLRSAAGKVLPTERQIAETLQELVRKKAPEDPNGDGVVTFEELHAQAMKRTPATAKRRAAFYRIIGPELDTDGDGNVAWAELERVLTSALQKADRDGDDRLSKTEIQAVITAIRDAKGLRRGGSGRLGAGRPSPCKLPRAREGIDVVAMQIGEGRAVPTVSLGGDGVVTTLTDLEIAPGDTPLFLVVAARTHVILRFSGATERVQRVLSIGATAGFTGIDRRLISWQAAENCAVADWGYGAYKKGRWSETLKAGLGRAPDRAHYFRFSGRRSLPGGTRLVDRSFPGRIGVDQSGTAAPIWKAFHVFAPGGLIQVRTGDVQAANKVTRYGVLPHLAGLATLVETGALDILDPGAMFRIKTPGQDGCVKLGGNTICGGTGTTTIVVGGGRYLSGSGGILVDGRRPKFEIRDQIRFPAGLRGAQAVDFVRRATIPAPTGDPGDSKVDRLKE